jgi:hypothetical protein
VITGCGTLTAEQQARVARVSVTTHEPDPRCQNLGPVDGSRESDGPRGMRGRAVILGGNAVHVDRDGSGTAFYCPDPDPDPEREPAEPVP